MIKPVLLIAFNRPGSTAKVLNAIKVAAPKELYIACDGPRNGNMADIEKCNDVKIILQNIDWDCTVHRLYHTENLGCSFGPRKAFDWFFTHVESGIILEDDCLPSTDFFHYCSTLLDYYLENTAILNICGSNMGANQGGADGYFFSRFMNMSGWATWRRSAQAVDYNFEDWKKEKRPLYKAYKLLRQNVFDTDIHWYKYWRSKFNKTIHDEVVSWWDWQWIFYQLSNKKLSIIPNRNLVTNIGFNEEATHTKEPENPLADIPVQQMIFPLKHALVIKPDIPYEEHYVKWVWCYHKRLPTLFYIKFYTARLLRYKQEKKTG
ncbi:MAG: hypothetical protein H7320_15940 [Ferruginibacter sp.]|nr:hypothetical protein [Ferruginibacter sp.]